MAALHAKVISVDEQQTLITSANLSYHGQEGNIELGTLVDSKEIAKQVDDIFTYLVFTKVVKEIQQPVSDEDAAAQVFQYLSDGIKFCWKMEENRTIISITTE